MIKGAIILNGKVLSVSPEPVEYKVIVGTSDRRGRRAVRREPLTGDAQYPVVADRESIGRDEECSFIVRNDRVVLVTFLAAQRRWCVTPDGELQTRSADAEGEWEQFLAAEQPPDWRTIFIWPKLGPVCVGVVRLI